MSLLAWFFIVYGVLSATHIIIQIALGHAEHRKQERSKFKSYYEHHNETVTVVVPVYNEAVDSLADCIQSIDNQDFKDLHIIIVDDSSPNYDDLHRQIYEGFSHEKLEVIKLNKNAGKRNAQKVAFDKAKSDIIVTIDSDTVLRSKKAISSIVKRFKDEHVGAVTGHVKVENKNKNVLTRLISSRYWMAFNQERAAQSYFNVLMCCSGPFSAYRRSVIDAVKEDYITQKFLGKTCTFGDDRHLTNLVLVEGHDVVYDKHAVAYTHVPENMGEYLKQQVRWNKSFYREMLWTLKSFNKHHAYLIYDLLMQLILPFMLLFALAYTLVKTFQGHPGFLYFYLVTLIGIAVVRAAYGYGRTHDKNFLIFIFYGFIHVFLLIPTRFYALLTIRRTGWGTR
jgi:hyaluronan synthase